VSKLNLGVNLHKSSIIVCLICTILCVFVVVVFSGCASAGHTSESVSKSLNDPIVLNHLESFEDLIFRLNVSPSENVKARKRLIEIGKPAVGALVSALDVGGRYSRKKKVEGGVRVVRVLRQMRTSAGMEVCRGILLGDEINGNSSEQWALLTEVFDYICENLSDLDVRDTYIRFLYDHKSKYMGKRYVKRHWRSGKNRDVFRVDVTYGVSFLVKEDDSRVKGVLSHLLRIVTRPDYGGSFVWRLAEDGYSIVLDAGEQSGAAALMSGMSGSRK